MRLIISNFSDPAKNLALEELLFKKWEEDICLLYRNSPSVIIGKHQNAFAEVNLKYCAENKIPVLRRISGGGTVYHDEGNINVSLITTTKSEYKVNYQPLLDLMRSFLMEYGLNATEGQRNDLFIGNQKITGTACHIFKSRTLHHGTLLYNANMAQLSKSTKVDLNIKTKGVESKRSSVINIRETLSESSKMDTTEFMANLGMFCAKLYACPVQSFEESESHLLDSYLEERYTNEQWNIDYSPKATVDWVADKHYTLSVQKGIIEEISEGERSDQDGNLQKIPKQGQRLLNLILNK